MLQKYEIYIKTRLKCPTPASDQLYGIFCYLYPLSLFMYNPLPRTETRIWRGSNTFLESKREELTKLYIIKISKVKYILHPSN